MKNTSGNKRADRERRRLEKKSHEFKNLWRPRVTHKKSTKITVAWIHGRDKPTQENRSKANKKPLLLSFFFQRKISFHAVEHTNTSRAWQRVSQGRKQAGTCQHRDPMKDLCPSPAPRCPPLQDHLCSCPLPPPRFQGSPVSSAHPDPTSPSLISGGSSHRRHRAAAHSCIHTHACAHTHAHRYACTHNAHACMCTQCMRVPTHACTHTHAHACTHTCTCTHMHARTITCMCVHTCTHACTHAHTHMHVHAHACAHMHTHMHMHVHADTHTQVDTPVPTSAVRLSLFQLPQACAAR